MRIKTWLCGPPPATGQFQRYPSRFESNLKTEYPQVYEGNTLHMFSGSTSFGTTTDIRPETGADIIAPYDALPDDIGLFDYVIADPPYTDGYAAQWMGHSPESKVPKPKRIMASASKVLRPEGLLLLLHILVVPAYKDLRFERVALHPILCGPNNVIRVLNVLKKHSDKCKPWQIGIEVMWYCFCDQDPERVSRNV